MVRTSRSICLTPGEQDVLVEILTDLRKESAVLRELATIELRKPEADCTFTFEELLDDYTECVKFDVVTDTLLKKLQ